MKKTFHRSNVAVVRFLLAAILLVVAAGQAFAGTISSDDFSGSGLNAAWQVLPGTVGAGLRYYNQGPLSSPVGWYTTSLAIALPFTGTSWEIDTEARYSLDWCTSGNTYTGPAVPNRSCSSGAQRPQVMVAFDPVTVSDRSALTGGNYIDIDRGTDAWYGDNHLSVSYGSLSSSALLNPADSAISNNIADGTYWYRIARNGGSLSISDSYDGSHYANALSATLANPTNPFNELILSATTFDTANSFTTYDHVNIESTSSTPEPGGFALMALGAACIGLGKIGRRLGPQQSLR